MIDLPTPLKEPPWLITRHVCEDILRSEIREWTIWAFGTACIDVSLSATRAAILVAGRNRDIVKSNSREQALYAALKIEPDPRFLNPSNAAQRDPEHLTPFLINVILKAEGPKLFNVAHGFLRRENRDNSRSTHHGFDETDWVLADPLVEYLSMKDVNSPDYPGSPFCLVAQRADRLQIKRNTNSVEKQNSSTYSPDTTLY